MRRLPSTMTLAAWLGFLAVSAVMRLAGTGETLLDRETGAVRQMGLAEPASLFSHVDLPSILMLGTASMLGVALYLLNEPRTDRRHVGELLGCGALGLVALIATAPGAGLLNIDTGGLGFWSLLLGTLVAVGFDRLITDEAPDDEEEFRAGIAFIAQALARQIHLYTGPKGPDSKAPMR